MRLLLDGYRVSPWDDEKILETYGGDGCTTVSMSSVPPNHRLKNGTDGEFYVICIFTTNNEII